MKGEHDYTDLRINRINIGINKNHNTGFTSSIIQKKFFWKLLRQLAKNNLPGQP